MSFNFKQAANLIGLTTLTLGSLMISQNVDAQLFRSNNCVCQPVRVVRPACNMYYAQPAIAQQPMAQTYFQPMYAQPTYSTGVPTYNTYNETIISESAFSQPITNEIAGSTINGVIETQTSNIPIQGSISDIPIQSSVVPATFNEPTPVSVEPVPAANTEPAKAAEPTPTQAKEGKIEKSILKSDDNT